MATRGKVKHKITLENKDERPIRSRKYKDYFLIVCEDERTEPYYFGIYQKKFDSLFPDKRTVFLKAVGTGRNSLGVVEQAIIERNRLQNEAETHVDHVWAVFDKDSLDETDGNLERYKQAFVLASQERIDVAYSNECFELWLLLHHLDVPSNVPLSRGDSIYPMLDYAVNKGRTEETKIPYDHKHPSHAFIDAAIKSGSQELAIKRAEVLDEYHAKQEHSPVESNPNTRVYRLVKLLNSLYAWYNN